MATYTPTYEPYQPYIRPPPPSASEVAAPSWLDDDDAVRPLTYTFDVPEGAQVEWPIESLENEVVRLEVLDPSMTLYLSTITTQGWNTVKPIFRSKSGVDQPDRLAWTMIDKSTNLSIATIGFTSLDPHTHSLLKPFLKPLLPSSSSNPRLLHHLHSQHLILSWLLSLSPSLARVSSPSRWSTVWWGVSTRETEESLKWAEELGYERRGELGLEGRMSKKKKEAVKGVDCTFGVQEGEGGKGRVVLYCR